MFFQKYDQETTKKLILQYQDTIADYKKENNKLLSQIDDLKTTLSLNQDLLYHSIDHNFKENENVTNLINKGKNIWKQNELLFEKKNDIEMKIDKLQKNMKEIPSKIREEVNKISVQINKKKNNLKLKDNTIKKIKLDLDKTRKSAFFKTARTEIFVFGPSRANIEKNIELINARNILTRVSKRESKEKRESEKLEREKKTLLDEMNKLKKISINLNNKNNKNIISGSLKNDDYNFLEKLGYNINVENSDKEYLQRILDTIGKK